MRLKSRGQLETFSLVLCSIIILVLFVKVRDERRLEPRYVKYRGSTHGSTEGSSIGDVDDITKEINVNPAVSREFDNAYPRPDITNEKGITQVELNQSWPSSFPVFPSSIPNIYLYNKSLSSYTRPLITFVHNPKSGGTTLKRCLLTLSEKEKKNLIPFIANDNRLQIEEDLLSGLYDWKSVDLVGGSSSMGICQHIVTPPRKCAYYTIVREPYDRMISHYYFCKGGGKTSLPCLNKTIEEYIVDVGSLFFRQLLYQVECVRRRPNQTVEYRCHRLLSAEFTEDIDELVDYLIQKLDSFFAVIGLTEEYDISLAILQDAFKFGFYDTCRGSKLNTAPIASSDLAAKQKHDLEKAEAKKRLLANETVRKVLRPDVLLYERAKEIFQRQKVLFMQKKAVDMM